MRYGLDIALSTLNSCRHLHEPKTRFPVGRLISFPGRESHLLKAPGLAWRTEIAAELGDGLIATEPDRELAAKFREGAGNDKPCYGEVHVCFDPDERKAQQLAHEIWPVEGLPGQLFSELPLPSLFEKAATLVSVDQVATIVPCGPDPEKHLNAIHPYIEAGFDHIFIHQIGPNQEPFMDFGAREIFPKITKLVGDHGLEAA